MITNSIFPLDGGCGCGFVRYRMQTRPMFVHCCHCRWCQRESGASFALNAMIESDRVVNLGAEMRPASAYCRTLKSNGRKLQRWHILLYMPLLWRPPCSAQPRFS
jgi:hypothetical protein